MEAFTGIDLLGRVFLGFLQARSLRLARRVQGRGSSLKLLLGRRARIIGCGQTY